MSKIRIKAEISTDVVDEHGNLVITEPFEFVLDAIVVKNWIGQGNAITRQGIEEFLMDKRDPEFMVIEATIEESII